jgi:esterase/lipase superfamily enzyme
MLHYLITNRAVLQDANGEYINANGGEAAGENLRFGVFDSGVYQQTKNSRQSIQLYPDAPAVKQTPSVQVNNVIPYDVKNITAPAKELFGSEKMFFELYKAMSGPEGGDLLFFVHGFHTDLDGSLQSVSDLEKRYVNSNSPVKHIVFFSWPAMNKYLRYRSDAKDAELSGSTLARCYLMLIDFFRTLFLEDTSRPPLQPCGRNIHLMAHSMGNRVVEHMMLELLRQKGDNITALFKEVILAASDVDWQVFEDPRAFYSLINVCQRTTIYFNTHDVALLISETTKNAYNRLGKFGFRDFHKVPSHVYSIDCSGVKDEGGLENNLVQHWYYKESPLVMNDITEVLNGTHVEDLIDKSRTVIPGNALQYRIKLRP